MKYYSKAEIKKVENVLSSKLTNYWTGKENFFFEKEFSKYIGNRYSVSVSNGSVALELAVKALNLKEEDQIIVTPRSFIISASCALNLGLKPVFADVDHNGNLNIDGILKVYNKKVKAIIVVHLNGWACDLDPIINFANKNQIYLIEDCSQAHGAKYKGKPVGSFGDISIWSFCQDKIISTGGEGGMISTNNKKFWQQCWSYKDHGKNYQSVFNKKHRSGFRWLHTQLGSNYRMTEMQAALGRFQLKHLDKQIKKRNQIASIYINGLREFFYKDSFFKRPNFRCSQCLIKTVSKECKPCVHAFYRLNLFTSSKKIKLIKLITELNKNNIKCGLGSCPEIYREKIFKKLKVYPKKRLPNAKLLGETSLMFPIDPYYPLSKLRVEIKVIQKILKNY